MFRRFGLLTVRPNRVIIQPPVTLVQHLVHSRLSAPRPASGFKSEGLAPIKAVQWSKSFKLKRRQGMHPN